MTTRNLEHVSCGTAVSPALTLSTKLDKMRVRNLEETDQQQRGPGSAGLDLSVGAYGLRPACPYWMGNQKIMTGPCLLGSPVPPVEPYGKSLLLPLQSSQNRLSLGTL